jgi:hypothetical protein
MDFLINFHKSTDELYLELSMGIFVISIINLLQSIILKTTMALIKIYIKS